MGAPADRLHDDKSLQSARALSSTALQQRPGRTVRAAPVCGVARLCCGHARVQRGRLNPERFDTVRESDADLSRPRASGNPPNPMRSLPCSRVARHHDRLRPGSCRAPKLCWFGSMKGRDAGSSARPIPAGLHPRPFSFRNGTRASSSAPPASRRTSPSGGSDSVQGRDARSSVLPASRKMSRRVGPIPCRPATPS